MEMGMPTSHRRKMGRVIIWEEQREHAEKGG